MTGDAGLARLHDLLDDTDWLKSHSYDPPDDAELSITITAKERRLILAALEAAESKLSALSEACRPFATLADYFDEAQRPMPDDVHLNHGMTLGDCRRVRALLHPTGVYAPK